MINNVVIANIINFFAGICSITSTQGRNKKQIVFREFIGSLLRIIGNFLVKSWSDFIAKIIKSIAQFLTIEKKITKPILIVLSCGYLCICLTVTYLTKDLRCLVAIIPSLMEFYSLLGNSTKKYRSYIIITKVFWTINNIIFQLYIGIIFDALVILGHFWKLRKSKKILKQ